MMPVSLHRTLVRRTWRSGVLNYASGVTLLLLLSVLGYVLVVSPGPDRPESGDFLWHFHMGTFLLFASGLLIEAYEFLGPPFLRTFLTKPITRGSYLLSVIAGFQGAACTVLAVTFLLLFLLVRVPDQVTPLSVAKLTLTETMVALTLLSAGALGIVVTGSRVVAQTVPMVLLSLFVMADGSMMRLTSVPAARLAVLWAIMGSVSAVFLALAVWAQNRKDIA